MGNVTIVTLGAMSRKLTDDELLARADIVDCWTPSWPGPHPMCTLREAVAWAAARNEAHVSLFLAGAPGSPAVWLKGDDISRLAAQINAIAA